MPPKNKDKKSATPPTLKKRKSAGRRKQQPPYLHPSDTEALSVDDKEEPFLRLVMGVLENINSRLGGYEKRIDDLTADARAPRPSSQVLLNLALAESQL